MKTWSLLLPLSVILDEDLGCAYLEEKTVV